MQKEEYINSLRKANYKITPQRLEVIDYVRKNNPGHFTAEEVYRNVRENEPTITLATVYNILRALRDSGSINSFEANGATWFETNVEFHGNLICRNCGNIQDVDVGRELINEFFGSRNYAVDTANLVLRGLCSNCNSKEKEKKIEKAPLN